MPATPSGEAVELNITKVSSNLFSWTIPCFAVMSLGFLKVIAEFNGREINALVKSGTEISVGKVRCTSHCVITIDDTQYMVLSEFVSIAIPEQKINDGAVPMPSGDRPPSRG